MVSATSTSGLADQSSGATTNSGATNNAARKSSSISIRTLMNQSTIYRRHEERRGRTLRLRGDKRPAFLRVVSLLPGLDIIVPRYDPDQEVTGDQSFETNKAKMTMPTNNFIGDYSEDTVFTTKSNHAIWDDFASEKNVGTINPSQSALQAMFATSTTSLIANYLWGIPMTQQQQQQRQSLGGGSNPFAGTRSHHSGNHRSSGRSLLQLLIASSSSAASQGQQYPAAAATTIPSVPSRTIPILIAASGMGTMFGTKTYLENMEAHESNHVFTSAVAGFFSGLIHRAGIHHSTGSVQSDPALYRFLGQHMVGATMYFGIYHTICDDGYPTSRPDMTRVAGAGALAGTTYTAVTSIAPNATWQSSRRSLSLLRTLLRAVPTHALLCCSYETMRYHCNSSWSCCY